MTKAILTVQIALTVTLVGSAALLLQTLTNFRRIDPGFQGKQLVAVTMDAGLETFERERVLEYARRATESLSALPGVTAVTYSNVPFGTGVPINLVLDVPGPTSGSDAASSGLISAGPGFVRTLGMSLLAGRDFEIGDREGSAPVAIVNESFATRFFGGTGAIGRTFAFRGPGNRPMTIVGIVKDARDSGIKRPTAPMMYLPFGAREVNRATFTIRADGLASSFVETVSRRLEQLEPAIGIARIRTVNAQLDDGLRRERLLAGLGMAFGGLALLLLAIGLFGMLNGLVARRTTEIGVRMALGAPRGAIVWLVAREIVLILFAGLGFGVAGYVGAGRLIQSELFGVRPADPIAVSAAVATLMVIAAVAVWIPTRRAIRIDPTLALRYDEA